MRVLFIGNSHTYYNDMPHLFAQICQEKGIDTEVTMLAHGGKGWDFHLEEPEVKFNIEYGGYDAVILQHKAHPMGDLSVMEQCGKELIRRVQEAGARPVLYMTWTTKADGEAAQPAMSNAYRKLQQETGITFVFVTHDQEEALSMSDTVVVMDGGVIQQIGTPTDIYNEPENAFVADFIGESNILDGVMLEDYSVKFAGHVFRCLDSGFGKNTPVDVVIRPEDIKVVEPNSTLITGDVTSVTFKGVHYEIIVDVGGFKWMIQSTECREAGDRIGLSLTPNDIHVMHKSQYSGRFGDYSTFSDEMGEDIIASDEAALAEATPAGDAAGRKNASPDASSEDGGQNG